MLILNAQPLLEECLLINLQQPDFLDRDFGQEGLGIIDIWLVSLGHYAKTFPDIVELEIQIPVLSSKLRCLQYSMNRDFSVFWTDVSATVKNLNLSVLMASNKIEVGDRTLKLCRGLIGDIVILRTQLKDPTTPLGLAGMTDLTIWSAVVQQKSAEYVRNNTQLTLKLSRA